jgi:N-acetylmuramoyl-L-alanine amidase
MKFASGLLLGTLLAFARPEATAASSRSEPVRFHGLEHVPLMTWARAQGFERRWLKREESFELTNSSGTRLQFQVDSREARVNGLQVWLLFPLVARDGEMYLSQSDVDHTLRPLLAPPRNTDGKKIKTICLDPGHGGKDSGNRVGAKQEKDYVLRFAFEVRDQLKRAGFKVYLTRTTDTFIELPDRPALARRRHADL